MITSELIKKLVDALAEEEMQVYIQLHNQFYKHEIEDIEVEDVFGPRVVIKTKEREI